ncbi:hypothetical protein [Lentzea sp.]|uniref:hypothetical protein n=1 Tax=Lentzea sp. TaxID=56099 RepID=UPI002B8F6F53|nr:hypothetical protein [Lentzea sp.]HUQ54784.1 hypothetical protein [Lentzea sp.]
MGRFTYLSQSAQDREPEVADLEITITTADEVRLGDVVNVEVTLRTLDPTRKSLPARAITGDLTITVGGAVRTEITATGLTNANRVIGGHAVLLTGGHAEFVAEVPGTYTFAAGRVDVVTPDYPIVCVPKDEVVADSKTSVA